MTILGTIYCNFRNCEKQSKEIKVNGGFRGWGAIKGRYDDETESDGLGLCPEHLAIVYDFATKSEDE